MGWSLGIDTEVVDDLCNFGGWSEIKSLIALHASAVPELAQFAGEGISGRPAVLRADIAKFLSRANAPDWVGDVLNRLAANVERHPDAQAIYISDGVGTDDEGFE